MRYEIIIMVMTMVMMIYSFISMDTIKALIINSCFLTIVALIRLCIRRCIEGEIKEDKRDRE